MGLRPKIFISSTFSDLTNEREFVGQVCEEMGFETLSFPEGSVAGTGTRDYLLHERDAQILIYLISGTSEAVDEELQLARKLGLFIIPVSRSKDVPDTALRSVVAKTITDMRFEKSFDSLVSLKIAIRSGISEAVALRLDDRRSLTEWSTASYGAAAQQVASVTTRFGAVQDTSSLILGPKVGRLSEEKEFIETVDAFVRRMRKRLDDRPKTRSRPNKKSAPTKSALEQWNEVFFIHLFHDLNTWNTLTVDSTKVTKQYPFASDRSEVLKELYIPLMKAGLIAFAGVSEDVSPILICDNSCEIGTKLAGRVYYGRYSEYGPSAGNLWGALREEALNGHDLSVENLCEVGPEAMDDRRKKRSGK
jgi:Domain of unknown function (DUF4062)